MAHFENIKVNAAGLVRCMARRGADGQARYGARKAREPMAHFENIKLTAVGRGPAWRGAARRGGAW